MNADAAPYNIYDAAAAAPTAPYGALPPGRPAESYFGSALKPAPHLQPAATVTPFGSADSVDDIVREAHNRAETSTRVLPIHASRGRELG